MLTEINTKAFYFLNSFSHQGSGTDAIFYALANGVGLTLLILTITIILFREWKKRDFVVTILHIFIPVGIAFIYSHALKDMLLVPRPGLVLDHVSALFEHGGMDSFPSGHATFYSALATSVYFYNKQFGIALGIGALLIGVARVVSGVHWPFDIVGGFLIGFLISYAYYYFFTSRKNKVF